MIDILISAFVVTMVVLYIIASWSEVFDIKEGKIFYTFTRLTAIIVFISTCIYASTKPPYEEYEPFAIVLTISCLATAVICRFLRS